MKTIAKQKLKTTKQKQNKTKKHQKKQQKNKKNNKKQTKIKNNNKKFLIKISAHFIFKFIKIILKF